MSSNYPELVFSRDEDFDEKRLNKAMEVLDARLRALEPFVPQWQAAVNELNKFGLARINDALQPAFDRVTQLANFGFLAARSDPDSSVTFSTGVKIVTIPEGSQRDLFTATPFVVLTREANTTDWAIARYVSYDKAIGRLTVDVQTVGGNPGPWSDVWVGASSGGAVITQLAVSATAANALATAQDRAATATSASNASASAQNASNSAGSALAYLNDFKTRYRGASDTAPTGPSVGQMWFDTNTGAMKVYNGSQWISMATLVSDYYTKAQVDASFVHVDDVQPVSHGGTGASDAAGARSNLGLILASVANWLANAASRVLTTDVVWSSADTVTLADAATIDANLSSFINAKVTLGGNRIISFSNAKKGQSGRIEFFQDGTGSRTISFVAGQCIFAGGTAPTLTTTPGARDVLYYDVLSDGKIFISMAKDAK